MSCSKTCESLSEIDIKLEINNKNARENKNLKYGKRTSMYRSSSEFKLKNLNISDEKIENNSNKNELNKNSIFIPQIKSIKLSDN